MKLDHSFDEFDAEMKRQQRLWVGLMVFAVIVKLVIVVAAIVALVYAVAHFM